MGSGDVNPPESLNDSLGTSILESRRVVVGVCGGIAAFKSAAVVSKLAQAGADVHVILTESGSQFIGEPTLTALSGRPVATSAFDSRWPLGPHIELARWADLLLVAPATANFIGKAANGIADDLLSTTYLAIKAPVLVAPAMNSEMWSHPATQRNLRTIKEDGVKTVGPDDGWLSCRVDGAGRMSEPETLVDAVIQELSANGRRSSAS